MNALGSTEGRRGWSPAWLGVLAYTLLVILFGAWVRISGSGDGCGQHWPTCQGELVHLPKKLETVIEMTHRLTSGLCLVGVVGLALWTRRRHAAPHPARRAAGWSIVFVLGEALVGAVIVLAKKTGNDSSVARAAIMALHLVNTCLLTFVLAWAARSAAAGPGVRFDFAAPRLRIGWWGAGALLLVSAAGAVTALGDTVFPATSHALLGPSGDDAHFLERVRGFHPVLAILASGFLFAVSGRLGRGLPLRLLHAALAGQLMLGVANVWLLAPGWMQVVHLAAANVVWLAWCWSCIEAAETTTAAETAGEAPVASATSSAAGESPLRVEG